MLIMFVTSIETMDSLHSPFWPCNFFAFYMITNLLFCISSPDVTCLHVLQAPWINALCGRGTHSATTTSRLCGLMRTCIAATRKVSHVFIYTYKLKVSGAHAPLGPTVDMPLSACAPFEWRSGSQAGS